MQQHKIATTECANITLTPEAQQHFHELILREFGDQAVNLRITISEPGTPKADVGITFCEAGDEQAKDFELLYPDFTLFIEHSAIDALKNAVIHYKADEFGGELSVKAPHIKGNTFSKDAPLQQRVEYIIANEINQNLASHGGYVSLVSIEEDAVVVLKFGGGCHGCGMADITMKTGIEKTLMQHCPDIKAVRDVTDHEAGVNPYFVNK
jgi:Fe/S biogenesis protein NfuA